MADTSIVVRLIDETRAGFQGIQRNIETLDNSTTSLQRSFDGLKAAAGAFVAVVASRATIDFIDTIQTMDNRLKLVTKSQEELNSTFNGLFEVAQRTRAPLDETVSLFSKLAQNQEVSRQSTDDLKKVTEAFTTSLAISGTSGQAAAGAIEQFAQAMASGKIQGDEFRTMAEANPKLLQVISEQTKIAREDLKELASKGFITAEIAALALKQALPDLQAEMANTNVTVRQAITGMSNEFQKLGRDFLDTSGTSTFLVEAIQTITENMKYLEPIVKLVGIALAGAAVYFAPWIAALTAITAGVVYFAKELNPLAQMILDTFGKALELVVPKIAGVGAALVALAQLENPFTAYKEASDKAAASFVKTEGTTKDLKVETTKLGDETKKTTGVTDEMKAAMDRTGLSAALTQSKYGDYIKTLQQGLAVAALDKDAKEVQIAVTKALEAATEDAAKKGTVLTEARKKEIEAEVTSLVTATQQKKAEYDKQVKDQEKALADAVDLLKKYSDEYKKNTAENLSIQDQYTEDSKKIEAAYNLAMANAKKFSSEELKTIQDNYNNSIKQAQTKALNDLYAEYSKYIETNKTEEQGYRDKLKELQDAYSVATIDKSKYTSDELAKIEKQYRDSTYALQSKSLDDLYKGYSKYLEDNKGATDVYQTEMQKLDAAYRRALENSALLSTEQIAEIERKHRESLFVIQTKSLDDLYKQYSKHLSDNKSDTEKYVAEVQKIDEAYRRAMENSATYSTEQIAEIEKKYRDALKGAQEQFSKDIIKIANEQRASEMDATQKYAEAIRKLNEAQNAGLIKDQETYDLARRKIEKDYREETTKEYSNLYGALTTKIQEFTGLNTKEFGILKDTVKLVFGVDIDTIIKQAFAEFIKYVIGFREAGGTQIGMFSGFFDKIFGKGGAGETAVSYFTGEAGTKLGDLSTDSSGIFDSIGGFIKSAFSKGLEFVSSFVSGAIDLLKGMGTGVGDIFTGIGNWIAKIFKDNDDVGEFADDAIDALGSMKNSSGGIFDTIGGFISKTFSGGLDIIGSFVKGALDLLGGLGSGAGSILGKVGSFIGDIFSGGGGGGIVDTVLNIGSNLLGGAGSAIMDIGSSLLGGAGSALGTIGLAGAGLGIVSVVGKGMDSLLNSFGISTDITSRDSPFYSPGAASDKANKQFSSSLAAASAASAQSAAYQKAVATPGTSEAANSVLMQARNFVNSYGASAEGFYHWVLGLPVPSTAPKMQFERLQNLAYQATGKQYTKDEIPRQLYFALGGIINRPTMFPTDGAIGISGEAGPEAILPLERGSDGRLGVKGTGDINVSFTINAIDSRGIEQLLLEKRQYITNMVRSAAAERGRSIY